MTMTKELWRERWLDSINELTSLDLQMKSWLNRTNTNPHWSFVEFMCGYFDDLFIEDNYQHQLKNGWMTRLEYEIIKDWHETLGKYRSPNNDDYDSEAILNDSKWLDIVRKGEVVKGKLKKMLTADEAQILTAEKNVA